MMLKNALQTTEPISLMDNPNPANNIKNLFNDRYEVYDNIWVADNYRSSLEIAFLEKGSLCPSIRQQINHW